MFIKIIAIMLALPILLLAAVTVNINSGNPSSPFPQFQPYINQTDALGNLATHNAVGVPHAEMEKNIREGYQIMMNRASKPGGGIGAIDFIKYESAPQCSEGDGYAMLAAVAMADKTTFDGLWLWIHENNMNRVMLYKDCKESNSTYSYSSLPGWTGRGAGSAADGDFDIALALLCAYRQWGEYMGIDDGCGNPISYKQAAIDFLKGLSDTLTYTAGGSLLSGDIGIDGYFKAGDSWAELSGWSTEANTPQIGITQRIEQPGPTGQYFDYAAPSYFHAFADFLEEMDSTKYTWNISQFRRAEASSDWLMGELTKADPKNLPICGNVSVAGTTASFKFTGSMGEDFRLGWRTVLNRVWHGNPTTTWDPAAHQVKAGGNDFEETIGKRFARFIWDARQSPWSASCTFIPGVGAFNASLWGPSTLMSNISMTGTNDISFYFLNWQHGAGSPSAVVSQDLNLMAEMYRQCEIEWDAETPGDGYLTSVPMYYHGWFRLLGMLVLTGNYTSPEHIAPSANMKVYCDVNKTCASADEEVTYKISYRNFGSLDAQGVVIVDTIPAGMNYLAGSDGATYDKESHTVIWSIGTVPGYKTATGIAPTTGAVTVKVTINDTDQKQCKNRTTIRCSNGSGWVSNEYPNVISAVMKRNYVDIIEKTATNDNGEKVLPILAGGRPGVRFSCSLSNQASSTQATVRIRMVHDAQEAYINYGNYRVSYFFYDVSTSCVAGSSNCTDGWQISPLIVEGINKTSLQLLHEKLVPGENSRGKWNQRLIVQFSNLNDTLQTEMLGTITTHLQMYRGISGKIHRGGTNPFRIIFTINKTTWQPVQWDDDWSWNAAAIGEDTDPGFPITPDFTDPTPGNPGVPVNSLHPKMCAVSDTTVDNILIEEWDGYVWRRVFGNAPQMTVATTVIQKASLQQAAVSGVGRSSITFTLPQAGKVALQLLDIKGRVVAQLFDGKGVAGNNIIPVSKHHFGSAIRIIRLKSEEGVVYRRIVTIR